MSAATSSAVAGDLVNRYLQAFYIGDLDRAARLLHPDFTFRGPFVTTTGRDAFTAAAAGLQPVVHGHRLLRQWIDRDQVSSIIEVDIHGTTSGTVSMSAWHTLRDNLIAAEVVLFDSPTLRELLTPPSRSPNAAPGR
jgi:ketosteroid isomerase-like protein